MIKLAICVLLMIVTMTTPSNGGNSLAQDTAGVVVTLKEKYGWTVTDTCTVLMEHEGQYVTVHRDRPSAYYPMGNWAVVYVEKRRQAEERHDKP